MRARTIIARAAPRPRTLETVEVLPGTRPRLLDRPVAVEPRAAWEGFGAKRRKLVNRAVMTLTLVAAGFVGALFGSGLYSVEGRFGAERLAAQTGMMELRGLPEVPGHPGARVEFGRKDVVRQMMALDGVQ